MFAGLALPPGLGPHYTRAHAAILDSIANRDYESGARLSVRATDEELKREPWQATLVVQPPPPRQAALVPTDLRGLMFLPMVSFIALAAAVPLGSWRKNLRLLAVGLPILELTLILLNCVPMISFLGGTGPIDVFQLSRGTHTVLQVIYRALVAPPGMMFALPLFLWWVLLGRMGGLPTTLFRNSNEAVRNSVSDAAATRK